MRVSTNGLVIALDESNCIVINTDGARRVTVVDVEGFMAALREVKAAQDLNEIPEGLRGTWRKVTP